MTSPAGGDPDDLTDRVGIPEDLLRRRGPQHYDPSVLIATEKWPGIDGANTMDSNLIGSIFRRKKSHRP